MGGRLAYISSASDNDAIVALMNANANVDKAWIGLNDRQQEGTYKWVREVHNSNVSQIPLMPGDYANWGSGEPSQQTGIKDCVHVIASTGNWHTRSCDQIKPSVCMGVAPPPSPPQPPAAPPPTDAFACYNDVQENTMVNQNAIDGLNYNDNADAIAACNAANAAEANSCSGIIYAPALGNWSARLYNVSNFREFPFPNVDWYSYNGTPGCDGSRRLRRQLVEDNPNGRHLDSKANQIPDDWWQDPYSEWLRANSMPAMPPYVTKYSEWTKENAKPVMPPYVIVQRRLDSTDPDLTEREDKDDHDHHDALTTPVRKKPKAGPLWGMFGDANDRF